VTDVRDIRIDEILAIARGVNGAEHGVWDMGLVVSAIGRPRTNVFGAESYPPLHEKAAALLYSVARNHALIGGDKRTAWLAIRVLLWFTGVSASTVPSPLARHPSPVTRLRRRPVRRGRRAGLHGPCKG
jgi:death-on-curing protein